MLSQHADAAFRVVSDELDEVQREVAALGDVPVDAADAITAGRADEFRALDVLAGRYTVCRGLHAELWKVAGPSLQRAHTGPLFWLKPAVVLEHDPGTVARLNVKELDERLDWRPQTFPEAWPGRLMADKLMPGPWPVDHDDRLPFLVWAAARMALWAPSPRQFEAAVDEIEDAVGSAVRRHQAGLPPQDGRGGDVLRSGGEPVERELVRARRTPPTIALTGTGGRQRRRPDGEERRRARATTGLGVAVRC